MKDFNQLIQEFEQLSKSDDLVMIKFYESNIDLIENTPYQPQEFDHKLKMTGEYGLSLVSAGLYSKATKVLKSVIQQFKIIAERKDKDPYEITYFEHLLWNYGVALWEIKNTKETKIVFEELVKHYPKNEKYHAWLNGLKANKIQKINNVFLVIGAFYLVGNYTFFDKLNEDVQNILSWLSIPILITFLALELYIYLLKRKKAN